MTTNSQAVMVDPFEPLIAKYDAWLAKTGYKEMSADELLHELLCEENPNTEHLQWLRAFAEEWEAVPVPGVDHPLDFDQAKKIVLELARQNLAPEDMGKLRARQSEACDIIEELAVNFHETD